LLLPPLAEVGADEPPPLTTVPIAPVADKPPPTGSLNRTAAPWKGCKKPLEAFIDAAVDDGTGVASSEEEEEPPPPD